MVFNKRIILQMMLCTLYVRMSMSANAYRLHFQAVRDTLTSSASTVRDFGTVTGATLVHFGAGSLKGVQELGAGTVNLLRGGYQATAQDIQSAYGKAHGGVTDTGKGAWCNTRYYAYLRIVPGLCSDKEHEEAEECLVNVAVETAKALEDGCIEEVQGTEHWMVGGDAFTKYTPLYYLNKTPISLPVVQHFSERIQPRLDALQKKVSPIEGENHQAGSAAV